MLDYEVIRYEVEFFRKRGCSYSTVHFDTEEEAIEFIKENRDRWKEYKLIKVQAAIIDF